MYDKTVFQCTIKLCFNVRQNCVSLYGSEFAKDVRMYVKKMYECTLAERIRELKLRKKLLRCTLKRIPESFQDLKMFHCTIKS